MISESIQFETKQFADNGEEGMANPWRLLEAQSCGVLELEKANKSWLVCAEILVVNMLDIHLRHITCKQMQSRLRERVESLYQGPSPLPC